MKLIDEKGRLFRVINLIDLVVLIVLVLVIGAIGYKFVGGKVKGTPAQTSDVVFTVRFRATYEAAVKNLKPGDKIISLTNYVADTYVDSVTTTPTITTATTADGEMRQVQHPFLKDIVVTIRTKMNPGATRFTLGPQDVAAGTKFTVKTHTVQLDNGTIESVQIK